MRDRDVTARESAIDKELGGSNGTLQAIGIDKDIVAVRTAAVLRQPLLGQPLTGIVTHVDFQHATFGGQLTARNVPLRPAFFGGLLQHAAVIGQRRAQIVTA